MRILIPVLMALLAAGCAGLSAPHLESVSTATSGEVVKTARQMLDEANVALTAAYRLVRSKYKEGIFTLDEARDALRQIDEMAEQADTAEALLAAGDEMAAKDRAAMVRRVIQALQKELMERARAQREAR